MKNIKQHLIGETIKQITVKEQEIQESDRDFQILGARLKVENKTLVMQDLEEYLKEDFKYSVQALEAMLAQEQQRNDELKKDLGMLKYRKAVIESQFSDKELDQ